MSALVALAETNLDTADPEIYREQALGCIAVCMHGFQTEVQSSTDLLLETMVYSTEKERQVLKITCSCCRSSIPIRFVS